MIDLHLVRGALDKIDGAFDLCEKGRTSAFVLAVNVRSQADGLRAIHADVHEALSGLADSIEAAGKGPKPKDELRALNGRYRAWRKDTLAVLEAESKVVAKAALADKGAAREALLAEARGTAGAAAPKDDAARKAAQAELEALGAGPADDDGSEMSIDEIERILADTKKKL